MARRGILTGGTWCIDRNILLDNWPQSNGRADILRADMSGGGSGCNLAIDMRKLTLAEITLIGTYTYTTADLRATVRALHGGAFGDLAWVVDAHLHQRQRLKDGVVQMGGDLGALLRADPLGALGRQAAHEPQPPRREDQGERDQHHDDREQHVAGRLQGVVEPQEHERAADHQRGPEEHAPDGVARQRERGRARRRARMDRTIVLDPETAREAAE